jgi:hypothetical protein
MLYIHESLPVSGDVVYDDGHCEAIFCTIDNLDTIVASVYRPPNAPENSFLKMMENLQSYLDDRLDIKHHDVYITGDFNFPNINWNSMSVERSLGSGASSSAQVLLSFMDRNFFTQVVNTPTRNNNILDIVLTNTPRYISDVHSNITKLSDHNLVKIDLGFDCRNVDYCQSKKDPGPFSFYSLDLREGDYEGMNMHMRNINWNLLYEMCCDDNGESFMELLRLTMLQLSLIYCPAKKPPSTLKPKKNRNKDLLYRKRRKIKGRLRSIELHQPNSPTIQKLKDELSLLHYDIRDAIKDELHRKEQKAVAALKTNPQYFFSYAKRHSKLKSNVGPLRNENGTLTHDPKAMAAILQKQYTAVFSDPKNPTIKDTTEDLPPPRCTLTDISFTENDIMMAIDEIDSHAATSHECIPAKVIKACKENICTPLHILWKNSYSQGKIPPELKKQYITPIYKKDSKADPSNYRPISLTSHVIKIFERVLRTRIVQYLEDNYILSSNQHGFRKGRSCLTQLLNHYDNILKNLNNGSETDVIYLDFAKAFDKVDHKLLLKKVRFYGIKGQVYDWIKEFLTGRTQVVTVDGHHSLPGFVISGVPQGTVLGPILFLIHINDLKEAVAKAKASSFADDTRLAMLIAFIADVLALQKDLDNVVQWSRNNNMKLHEGKFELLSYSTNSSKLLKELPFTSGFTEYSTPSGFVIEPKPVVKDLGVYLSSDYSWTPHITQMVASARKMAAWVLGVFKDRSKTTMLQLWKSLIRCRTEYCCPLWNPIRINNIKAIEDVQRFFTKRIAHLGDMSYWDRLKVLKLQSLQRRRERYVIIHVWKMLNNIAPNDIKMEFHHHQRLGWTAKLPPHSKNATQAAKTLYDASFAVHGAKLWNILPKDVKEHTNLDGFKNALWKFMDRIPDNPPVTGYTTTNNNSIIDWCNQPGGLREKL